MGKSSIRVLIVDDYEPWRRFFSTKFEQEPELQIVGQVSDGLQAVQQAHQLHPDLILLDIGLPALNGIEAARRIRQVSPASKILFVSENRAVDVVEEALSTGAGGYVLKSDAAGELLAAVNAVLEGKRFVSASLASHALNGPPDPQTGARFLRDNVTTLIPTQKAGGARHHEIGFYSDDRHFLDDVTRFIESALKEGSAAIVVATKPHRESLLSELQECGLDMGAAIEQGRYIQLDAADAPSMFMINGIPDAARFLELFGDLIVTAREATTGPNPRVSVFGESVDLIWAQGNADAAIQIEKLSNKLTQIHDVDILCGCSQDTVEGATDKRTFEQICAQHSAVHSHR